MSDINENTYGHMDNLDAILLAHIVPLLPGAKMYGPYLNKGNPGMPVCYDTAHRLKAYFTENSSKYYRFTRTLPFFEDERAFIEEIILGVRQALALGMTLSSKLVSSCVLLAVSRRVAPSCPETLTRLIQTYEKWSGQAPAAHTTGIRLLRHGKAVGDFFRLEKKDLLRALGSSSDTMLVMDIGGGVLGIEKIPQVTTAAKNNQEIFAPVALAGLAAWANSPRKAVVRLFEDGTILVFSKRRLLFVKHGQYWHCLPHTLANPEKALENIEDIAPETIKAVYLTALDMASGRAAAHGWQIRIYRRSQAEKTLKKKRRATSFGNSSKNAKLLFSMIKEKKFHEIPRTIRAEICAMGGVLLLDYGGNILGFDPVKQKENGLGVGDLKTDAGNGVFRGKQCMEILNNGIHPGMHLDIR